MRHRILALLLLISSSTFAFGQGSGIPSLNYERLVLNWYANPAFSNGWPTLLLAVECGEQSAEDETTISTLLVKIYGGQLSTLEHQAAWSYLVFMLDQGVDSLPLWALALDPPPARKPEDHFGLSVKSCWQIDQECNRDDKITEEDLEYLLYAHSTPTGLAEDCFLDFLVLFDCYGQDWSTPDP